MCSSAAACFDNIYVWFVDGSFNLQSGPESSSLANIQHFTSFFSLNYANDTLRPRYLHIFLSFSLSHSRTVHGLSINLYHHTTRRPTFCTLINSMRIIRNVTGILFIAVAITWSELRNEHMTAITNVIMRAQVISSLRFFTNSVHRIWSTGPCYINASGDSHTLCRALRLK